MKVVQCWDDGVTADIRLIDILRKYKANATFNLNAGLYGNTRGSGWDFKGTKVERLEKGEMVDVYEGFKIANHSLSHPRLETLTLDGARIEIRENRKQLQDIFGQPVDGFAYPFGSYHDSVMAVIQEEGHFYAERRKAKSLPSLLKARMHFIPLAVFWQKIFGNVMKLPNKMASFISGAIPTK